MQKTLRKFITLLKHLNLIIFKKPEVIKVKAVIVIIIGIIIKAKIITIKLNKTLKKRNLNFLPLKLKNISKKAVALFITN